MTNIINITPSQLDIGIPGVSVTQNALVFADDAPRSSLEAAGKFLGTVEGSRSWWNGDYVNALRKFRGEHYGAAEAAVVMGIEEATLRQAVQVSAFFPPAARVSGLSWSHHNEAYAGADGDLAVAQNWLQKAVENKMSTRDLREAIRTADDDTTTGADDVPTSNTVDLAAEAAGDPGPAKLGVGELKKANAWARAKLEEKWKPDATTAAEILEAAADLRELLGKLVNIAAVEGEEAA